MKASIIQKLEHLQLRFEELASLLSTSEIISDQAQFTKLSKEYSELEPIVKAFAEYQCMISDMTEAEAMLSDGDEELKELAKEELSAIKTSLPSQEKALELLMIPQDPLDEKNVYLEIRAGTGGDEAAIFAGDLFRMYAKYAELKRWRLEILSENEGEHGGYKEVIVRIIGDRVYSHLKFESGAHRVQRVPATESQGRIHTSACTVAILPELDDIDAIDINPSDLKVDTFRASGAGGQHVNKTDSAIRITHIPTGVVVECQDERSQHKNRAKAMGFLQAKLLEAEQSKQREARQEERRNLVGSGDRSERIRTYNYPQGRLTDHRINLTLYKLNDVMEGALDEVIGPLIQEHQADQLAMLSDDA